LGQPEKGITLSYRNVIFRDLRLVGSLVAGKAATEELVTLVAKHDVHVEVKTWQPEQAEDMRQEHLRGKGSGKNAVVFN
jgi:alcohol dehydrogenase, propanol-preferring